MIGSEGFSLRDEDKVSKKRKLLGENVYYDEIDYFISTMDIGRNGKNDSL